MGHAALWCKDIATTCSPSYSHAQFRIIIIARGCLYTMWIKFIREGFKKKNWKIPIRGGGSARVDFPIKKKKKNVLKTLEIA